MDRQKLKKPEKVTSYIMRGIVCIIVSVVMFGVLTAKKNLYEKNDIFFILMYVMDFLWLAGGIFVICVMITVMKNYRILQQNGTSCTGEIVKIIECIDINGTKLYDVTYIYNDDNGNQQTGKANFEKNPPETNEYTVIYAKKHNGKYISEMIH